MWKIVRLHGTKGLGLHFCSLFPSRIPFLWYPGEGLIPSRGLSDGLRTDWALDKEVDYLDNYKAQRLIYLT